VRERAQTELDARRPACPTCTMPMTVQHSEHGYFWGCRRFPKCRGKRSMDVGAERLVRVGAK
jgi:ssDNA-binding Zn-finger/Zn-ribbon topoisomerase 1